MEDGYSGLKVDSLNMKKVIKKGTEGDSETLGIILNDKLYSYSNRTYLGE